MELDDEAPPEGDTREPIGRRVSWSQLSKACGLALKFHRERAPQGPRSISLIYGSALHYGIEVWLGDQSQPIAYAIEAATAHLHDAALRAELGAIDDNGVADPGIAWDDAPRMTEGTPAEPPRPFKGQEDKPNPRMTKGKEAVAPEPVAADAGNITSVEDAEALLVTHLRTWIWGVGRRLRVASTEQELAMSYAASGYDWIGRLDIEAEYLDPATELSGAGVGIIDIKSANRPWSNAHHAAKFGQAYEYMAAYTLARGRPPAFFEFHVLPKGDGYVQVVRVPYHADAIDRYLAYVDEPKIAAIEAGIYVANLDGPYPHSEKFCSYWHLCPLGAAANPKEATDANSRQPL